MDGEAAVAPGEHARRGPLADCALGHHELDYFRTKSLFERFYGNSEQRDEHAITTKQTVGAEHMDMGG